MNLPAAAHHESSAAVTTTGADAHSTHTGPLADRQPMSRGSRCGAVQLEGRDTLPQSLQRGIHLAVLVLKVK